MRPGSSWTAKQSFFFFLLAFCWFARKGAKAQRRKGAKRGKRRQQAREPHTPYGRVVSSQSHSPYSHSLQTLRSKTARICVTNAKNTTVLRSREQLETGARNERGKKRRLERGEVSIPLRQDSQYFSFPRRLYCAP